MRENEQLTRKRQAAQLKVAEASSGKGKRPDAQNARNSRLEGTKSFVVSSGYKTCIDSLVIPAGRARLGRKVRMDFTACMNLHLHM